MKLAACLLTALFAALCLLPSAWATTSVPTEGVRDLRQWDPVEDGTIYLNGPWEFYWNSLWSPDDLANGSQERAVIVALPAQWQSYTVNGRPLTNQGYATYRTLFSLSSESASQPLSLYINNVASAYRVWINGKLLKGNGTVGTNTASMVPRSYPKMYSFVPRSGVNEIVLQVSNFAQRTGGIWEAIELGDTDRIASQYRNRIIIWALITGSLALMAVYSVFLYLFRNKEIAALWFGLICLAIGIRSSLLGESYAYVLLPGLSWEWGVKLEYLSEIVTLFGIAVFVNKQYPQEALRRLFLTFGIGLAGFGAFVLAAPAKVYTQYLVPYLLFLLLPVFLYVLYVYIRAAFRRRTGSRMNFVGFVVFFATVVQESLYYTGLAPFGGFVPFGLLFFLVTQLLNLTSLFTRAMFKSEELSIRLNRTIESQEETIRQRTESLVELNSKLEQGNQELIRIENVRSQLLADVHHDLSTPLTSIKGFSKAIMTYVITDEAPQYAKRIYERSLMLEKLIDNVVELSQLQTGEVPFQWQEEALVPLLRELVRRFDDEANARQIVFQWKEPILPLPPYAELRAMLDPYRFERVIDNLMDNAMKYTAVGGAIHVWMEYHQADSADQGYAVIHVTDTGIGIPESELPHIFKRRYRIQNAGQAVRGSGLGLAICQEIVDRHQGTIEAVSRPGEGSDFRLTIPVFVREAQNDHQ